MIKEANECQSYQLVGNMEMLENDELKSYQVTSTYARLDKKDYYKVELYDKSLNQSQVIVKNDEGVFVLTPSLNQAFQFQSEWPNNSPKPYIYQSLISFLKENQSEKIKDGYLVQGEMAYENDERVKSQEIKFDKDLKPVYISVFDQDGTEIIKVEVTSFTMNETMKKDDFLQKNIIKTTKTQYTDSVAASLPLYPVSLMGSTLENEKVSTIDDEINHILKFTGEKSFTIVEKTSKDNEELKMETIDGYMIDMIDGVAFENDQQMTYISSGIVCSLYSNDLTTQEKLAALSSMQSSQVK
ncbi:hypothetical protein NMU03_12420 [Allocoprobacillus halotolerans]|uniref:Outer membrane lipoprotein-sorting protein n=1 Tax=Allocoprobacillus halotolerans TaxID=2944914 RepID=A0ABY5HZH4_9FIRM|nr:hypothetical protein [Allocoprobacillus halotolerans]UTY38451.1 hypothetical protein NMU03_12420 [Allocoprobacillus halotolerans]